MLNIFMLITIIWCQKIIKFIIRGHTISKTNYGVLTSPPKKRTKLTILSREGAQDSRGVVSMELSQPFFN